ncbi:GNAT family N-acetyltransferase [Leptolyngbya sp. FACHB-711]|uniref:GNAT family N-acetyltransferase n=1 Tax=Leptolyngbya sp. FACHB-711 TaxID=2692813 RepID=UPI001685FF95|nr:GNAT family N-acetyltransferase [Leptolyngbya sp. FACHB-711]MBD1848904.1 N-acetyltransferase [Cyanobacteria bacterium FACHB-502]MBD2024417.1 N-acetyltransferase [Leptolyngbya sp. FACHB-711]
MFEKLQPRYAVQWIHKIEEIPQAEWDAIAVPLKTPFLEWTWLHNMETSGSVGANSGWLPTHLTVWRDRSLVAAAPLYLKSHSYGEFVFDHQWADLAARLGVAYYPKMLGMSPFTPAEGYRFLIAPGEDEDELTELMVNAIDHFCMRHKISGCNFLYVDPEWRSTMERHGFFTWLHHSYIWQNQNFQSFEDYLGAFNANQRRNIKRERKAVSQAGLRLQPLTGEEISRSLLSHVYHFYADTCDKFGWWGSKYLTRRFFEQLYPDYLDRVVLFGVYSTEENQHPIGMSFCLTKGDRLYGRYWGATQEFDNLHFDTCYYTPIEWGIANGIQLFDPGAGGRHKKRRGFAATPNYSLHRLYQPRLSQILHTYIDEINEMEQQEMDAINQELPFKQTNPLEKVGDDC